MDIKLRWYQKEAPAALIQSLETSPDNHPVAAIPTGGGKTVIICEFIDKFLSLHPDKDVLVLSHVKEILEQNWDAITNYYPIDIGLYSAGLDSKTIQKITVAGIQSVYNKPELFPNIGIVIIDECHLVTTKGTGMYRKFLKALQNVQYVGLTATHFRLGHGYIHEGDGALFNDLAYDLTSVSNFNKLVDEGYLTKLIAKATDVALDTDGLKTSMGDFITSEMSEKYDTEIITEGAIREVIQFGKNYKKWLIFAIDIEHAEHIQAVFKAYGVNVALVHSKMADSERDAIVRDVKRTTKYRGIVNVNILTTGFDVPDIDLIALLRPTQSPVLHVQSIGRGLRVAPGKTHCLVLDFAGNVERLGPINDVRLKKKGKGKGPDGPPVKKCPNCKAYCHPKAKVCPVCNWTFKFEVKIRDKAAEVNVVKKDFIGWVDVDRIAYKVHRKIGKPNSLKVTYDCGGFFFSEWVCIDHPGYPGDKAREWVKDRYPGKNKPSNLEALFADKDNLKVPTRIVLDNTGIFAEVLQTDFYGRATDER